MLLTTTHLTIVDNVIADQTVSEGFQAPGQPCSLRDSVEGNFPKGNPESNKNIHKNKAPGCLLRLLPYKEFSRSLKKAWEI